MKKSRLALPELITCLFILSPLATIAQTNSGFNAVVQSSSGTVTPSASYAFVDANSMTGADLCLKISAAFSSVNVMNSNGVVVDARGVPSSLFNCTSDPSPWDAIMTIGTLPNTVLLPSGIIVISKTWHLPNNTILVGEGSTATILSATSSFTGADMIDMGEEAGGFDCEDNVPPNYPDCPGIVIQHLGLSGNGSVTGIVNCCAQELSRVTDVQITNVTVGLSISDKYAENSGPYSNLSMANVNTCISVEPTIANGPPPNTRGFHGLHCAVNSGSQPAIMVDTPSNSFEDISLSGSSSQDGIRIGYSAAAQGNVFYNIQGTGFANVIHIENGASGGTPSSPSNCPNNPSGNYVCDVSIFGISRSGGSGTIQNDLLGTSIPAISDSTVAMYVVGEEVQDKTTSTQNIGYSVLTTATASGNTPTWLVGGDAPTSTSSCAVGSLFSCTGNTSVCTLSGKSAGLWECIGGGTWKAIQ